jgi:hypothetical protein
MMRLPLFVALSTVAAMCGVAVEAQQPTFPTQDIQLPALKSGQTVRIVTSQGERLSDRVLAVSESALHLARSSVELRSSDIDSLWVRTSRVGTGTKIGLIVSAGLGVGTAVSLCSTYQCSVAEGVAVSALYGVIAGMPGACLGALIGAAVRRWDLRFVRGEPF